MTLMVQSLARLETEDAVVSFGSGRAARWYSGYGASSNLVYLAAQRRRLPVMGRLYKCSLFHGANTSEKPVSTVQA